jgi:hypothetical protein
MREQSPSRLLKEVLGLALLALALLLPAAAQAQAAGQAQASPQAPSTRQRLALVVGVGTVGGKPVLDSARRDSEAVAAALKAGGYQVLLREDASANELRAALKEFRDKLRADGAGLIYYTGLAAQVDGRNLLVPADLNLSETQPPPVVATVLRAVGVPLQELVDALAGGPDSPRMLLVDAAYRHPALARLSPPGLTRQRLPAGLIALLGHAPAALQDPPTVEPLAAPLKDARDGAASRFARVVVDALTTPRISAPEALRAVRLAVQDSSGGRVQPWLNGDTSARDHLADAALLEAPATTATTPTATATAAPPKPAASSPAVAVAVAVAAAASAPAPVTRPNTDGRTAQAPGQGERPVYQARINSFGHAEGDVLSYQLTDTRRDEVLQTYTLSIDQITPDGQLSANGGAFKMDPEGRLRAQKSEDGSTVRYEPSQDWWWARPQVGESRSVGHKETYARADNKRGVIDWRGTAQVGSQRQIETVAGDFDVLPIKTTGTGVDTPEGGTPRQLQFTRTVWFAPKLGVPVAMDIEDNDETGKPLRRERIELTHAQQQRTAN